MCSFIAQFVYGFLMFIAYILMTMAAITPWWSELSMKDNKPDLNFTKLHEDHPVESYAGLWAVECMLMNKTEKEEKNYKDMCDDPHKETFQSVTLLCLCVAGLTMEVALVYNFFTCCACCCKNKRLLIPLPIMAGIFSLFVAIACIIFAVSNPDRYKDNEDLKGVMDSEFASESEYDYENLESSLHHSFWMAIVSMVFGFIAIGAGALGIVFTKEA